ncbi:MAG: hypothetical protein IPG08_17710 [Sphingobacteriaceae bacterium]|nr:hypothetical protein [Sphingobacteriaceae bacterium]
MQQEILPSNFLNIKPILGTLESSKDTISVASGSNINQAMEFTLSNFTVSTPTSWITSNITNGTRVTTIIPIAELLIL